MKYRRGRVGGGGGSVRNFFVNSTVFFGPQYTFSICDITTDNYN